MEETDENVDEPYSAYKLDEAAVEKQ